MVKISKDAVIYGRGKGLTDVAINDELGCVCAAMCVRMLASPRNSNTIYTEFKSV